MRTVTIDIKHVTPANFSVPSKGLKPCDVQLVVEVERSGEPDGSYEVMNYSSKCIRCNHLWTIPERSEIASTATKTAELEDEEEEDDLDMDDLDDDFDDDDDDFTDDDDGKEDLDDFVDDDPAGELDGEDYDPRDEDL